jgi:cell wall-associated NlpC family hydrolase
VRFIALSTAALLVTGCTTTSPKPEETALVAGDPSAPSQLTPADSMAIAHNLSTHPWRPFAGNILHGKDKAGIHVNTPDIGHAPQDARKGWWIPGEVNAGIPYKWGGFDSPASFDVSLANGLAAGDVSSPAKRLADNSAVSDHAAGLDCSGFVSRCLKLPKVHDTSQLPMICDELPGAGDLRPGDLLNIPRRHVLLCAGWSNPERTWIYYYETGGGPDYWRPGLKQAPLDKLLALGYKPLRYRGMAHPPLKPGESAKEVLTRSMKSKADMVPDPTVGEP